MRDDPWKTLGVMILILVTGAYVTSAQNDAASQILFDFGPGFNVSAVETSDAKATLTDAGALRVRDGPCSTVARSHPEGAAGQVGPVAVRVYLAGCHESRRE